MSQTRCLPLAAGEVEAQVGLAMSDKQGQEAPHLVTGWRRGPSGVGGPPIQSCRAQHAHAVSPLTAPDSGCSDSHSHNEFITATTGTVCCFNSDHAHPMVIYYNLYIIAAAAVCQHAPVSPTPEFEVQMTLQCHITLEIVHSYNYISLGYIIIHNCTWEVPSCSRLRQLWLLAMELAQAPPLAEDETVPGVSLPCSFSQKALWLLYTEGHRAFWAGGRDMPDYSFP